jgi:hypothetical protein
MGELLAVIMPPRANSTVITAWGAENYTILFQDAKLEQSLKCSKLG